MLHRFTYDQAPQRVYWETTSACDLACRHCRAEASPDRDPAELTTEEGRRLLTRLAAFGTPLPHVVLTGGDPLKRDDLFDLVAFARGLGFGVSLAPSATPLLTEQAIFAIKAAGVDAISLSLDGPDAATHDAIRGVPGTYERTLSAARAAREVGLPFQVNTLVCEETIEGISAIHERVVAMGAARWSLFFLVTVGRGHVLQPISPERAEALLAWVADLARQRMARPGKSRLIITTTEAPHIRRVVAEQRRSAPSGHPAQVSTDRHQAAGLAADHPATPPAPSRHAGPPEPAGHPGAPTQASHGAGIRDGNGILFISNTGDICPSGFLELATGNVRTDDIVEVYRSAPLFRDLREPDAFAGRCGRCEYRHACGGSRARAYAASGDPLGEDPLCPHEPAGQRVTASSGPS